MRARHAVSPQRPDLDFGPEAGIQPVLSMETRPIAFYNSLAQAKGRKEHKCFLVEGPKLISDLLESDYPVQEILLDKAKAEGLAQKYSQLIRFSATRILDSRTFGKIAETQTSQGVAAVVAIPPRPELKRENALVLNGIQDPGNVGTLIRSAVAFGVRQVLYDSATADPFSPKVIRASAGAFSRCALFASENLVSDLETLKKQHLTLCALTAAGTQEIGGKRPKEPYGLIVGSEGSGIAPEILAVADVTLRIPIRNVESLNAAVAGSIALFDFCSPKQSTC